MNILPIDSEDEPLFQFDPDERFTPDQLHRCSVQAVSPTATSEISSHDDPTVVGEMEGKGSQAGRISKGKGVALPVSIRIPYAPDKYQPRLSPISRHFSPLQSFSDSDSSGAHSPSASTSFGGLSVQTPSDLFIQSLATSFGSGYIADERPAALSVDVGKGKGRAAPVLPPLSFSPTSFESPRDHFPSLFLSPVSPQLSINTSPDVFECPLPSQSASSTAHDYNIIPEVMAVNHDAVPRKPARSHSFSSLSIHSDGCLSSSSVPKLKLKFGRTRTRSNLARKLLLRKHDDNTPSIEKVTSEAFFIQPSSETHREVFIIPPASDALNLQDRCLPYRPIRSLSTPLPFSVLDLVEVTPLDVFEPIPISVRNLFDELLPRELQLRILANLIDLHRYDYERLLHDGLWSAGKASSSKHRWVGKAKALRELVKFSRVSKSWRKLVFDGGLWTHFDLQPFQAMRFSSILFAASNIRAFAKTLNLAGFTPLPSNILMDMVKHLRVQMPVEGASLYTQLTVVNITGCKSLTTQSLHHLLIRSPHLQTLIVKGLGIVTNSTSNILAEYCPKLRILDVGRCRNMSGKGILEMCNAALGRGQRLQLRQLRSSHLRMVDDDMMKRLGQAAPFLEALDLSHTELHNSALEAFVACDSDIVTEEETIVLNAREAGRPPGNTIKYRRRVTRLRHLNLSSCRLLTDLGCSNLAHAMPCLEFLELAGIGNTMSDDGLIHLLETVPGIRKLDLEGASGITDGVISALTPDETPEVRTSSPQLGTALESLSVSHVNNLTSEALLAFVRRCPRLKVLEADDTRISSTVIREFVHLNRKRRQANARVVAVDCRGVSEHLVKQLSSSTRPRLGWRAYEARKLDFLDARDDFAQEDLKAGQDECDESRVVLKTFYSWQAVDTIGNAREARRKKAVQLNNSGRHPRGTSDSSTVTESSSTKAKWWSRTSSGSGTRSGSNSPPIFFDNEREGCVLM